MNINFFEEFPTAANLSRLRYVTWKTKLFVAAPSVSSFVKLEKQILKKYPQVTDIVFWPTLSISEGYWISPWSESKVLESLFHELLLEQKRRKKLKGKAKNFSIMLDFEFPKQKRQILSRFFSFSSNRKLIVQFLVDAQKKGISLYNIEMSHLPESLVWMLGLGYSPRAFGHKNIAMYYSSFIRPFVGNTVGKFRFTQKVKKFARRKMIIGVGLIAGGIHKTEPTYGSAELEEDLKACFETGCKEVIVFRLGGMNSSMQKVCEKFV